MRLLVTGGAGFIGSHVCSRFAASGVVTTAFDAFRNTPGRKPLSAEALDYRMNKLLKETNIVVGELSDKVLLRETLANTKPDCVIHLAGLALADVAQHYPAIANQDILQSTISLIEELPKTSVRRFIYVSSSMVYGDFGGSGVDEDSPTRPMNIYGGLKLAGEILVQSYLKNTDTEMVIVRPSAVYGPGGSGGRVVERFCEQALAEAPITISNPHTLLDFTFVDDLVTGLELAATKPAAANEIFNLTFGKAHSLLTLADCVKACCPTAEIQIGLSASSLRPERGVLDCSKAKRLLGFAPTIALDVGVQRYVTHLKTYPCAKQDTATGVS